MSYQSVRAAWCASTEAFWSDAADAIDWITPWSSVVSTERASGSWFSGATLNTCFNALDRHVPQYGDKPALIFDSAMTGEVRTFTYRELRDDVAQFAGAMQRAGIQKGDRVVIYMPMVAEAVIAMLACARLWAVHSVVFGGFAAGELAVRISEAKPKLILSASCGLEPGRCVAYKPLLDQALQLSSHQPQHVVILQRPQLRAELGNAFDQEWTAFVADAVPADCVSVAATDPLYILYTSGTTGQPKGIVRDNGGHAVALQWSMRALYDIGPDDVFWAASDIGWVVGHSYIVYGPLLAGATTVMYEGKPVGTPDAAAFWRVVDTHNVNVLFTAPTAIRAIKRDDPELALADSMDLSSLRALFLAGERCDPDTLQWAEQRLGVPVIDHWWQTETGWAIAGTLLGEGMTDVRVGSAGKALPGWDVRVVNDEGEPLATGEVGAIVCKLPLAPGAVTTLWEADARFNEQYFSEFPGFYETGDAGYIDADGYIFVMARTDDVINVAGHRLSTGALEEVLATHPAVAECAVTGVHDALKGQTPLGFVCLKAGAETDAQIVIDECVALVREQIGPVAAFRRAVAVSRLPKTRSGKILRGTLSKIADGITYKMPATIDDPKILDEIESVLDAAGMIKQ
ncbi:MAG: AMP-binding protein [Pseudomonadota bacterium]